jgi:hypothetical protein
MLAVATAHVFEVIATVIDETHLIDPQVAPKSQVKSNKKEDWICTAKRMGKN